VSGRRESSPGHLMPAGGAERREAGGGTARTSAQGKAVTRKIEKKSSNVPVTGNDSDELEALFDSIAATRTDGSSDGGGDVPAAAAQSAPAETSVAVDGAVHAQADCPAEKVISRVGRLARSLHEELRDIGLDDTLQRAATTIPDTRERLSYIASMTAQAANRVLNATDAARPIQDDIAARSEALGANWDALFAGELGPEEFRQLAADTREWLAEVPRRVAATNAHLHEIMMAQDFQDLTGQVIKKVTDVVQDLERQLVGILLENPPADRPLDTTGLKNGPLACARDAVDAMDSQEQVDELLESMGF